MCGGYGAGALSREPYLSIGREEVDEAFQRVAGFSALAEMLKSESESQIQKTEYAQLPTC